jgi:Mg2+/Co2+ transporter CorB
MAESLVAWMAGMVDQKAD